MIFPPVLLKEDAEDARPIYSVQIELPSEIDAELCRFVTEDEPTSRTVMIHTALYAYRRQFWTREQLREEFVSAIQKGISSADERKGTLVTPQFWKEFKASGNRQGKEIEALRKDGKIGNLLLPQELYAFVSERIASGECKTSAEVICSAMPYLRKEREKST